MVPLQLAAAMAMIPQARKHLVIDTPVL